MKGSRLLGVIGGASALLLMSQVVTAQAPAPPAQPGPGDAGILAPGAEELAWPRTIQQGGENITIYQPQVEKWNGPQISCRAAVSVQAADAVEPVFGVVWLTADAEVDKAARVVTLQNFKITRTAFPTAPEKDAPYADVFRKLLPEGVKTVALDHLEASLAVSEAVKKHEALQVRNETPRIVYATKPTVLVLVDGPAVLRAMPGLDAERVLNTRALIARVARNFYLAARGFWYEAASLDGPWVPIDNPPALLEKVKDAALATKMVDLMEPPPTAAPPATPPAVVVSTAPAEVIQTDGPPMFLPIEGTQLLQVQNTDDAVFLDVNTNKYYALLAGRWFRSKSLKGPWDFVPARTLPGDFAKIPPEHPRANALVSVPGTPQAQEALIANSIPQMAIVNRSAAKLSILYDGAPLFQQIEGTPLQYAVNASLPVIKVAERTYFSVQNGVWFTAADPMGPWSAATTVPPVIYTIPISSPLHYVTYVYVYDSTPDEVYAGYTPGYLGTVVSTDGVVVYGTGYVYPPYCGSVWIGYPCTYGFQAGFCCDADMGFGFGFGLGFVPGCCPRPWWGPFGWARGHDVDFNHISLNHVSIFRNWDRDAVAIRHHFEGNHWDAQRGWSNVREPFNPYSARFRAGGQFDAAQGRAVPSRTGGGGGWDANARPRAFGGITLPPRSGMEAGIHGSANGEGLRRAAGDVYAGPRGEVFRHSPATGWQQRTTGGWQGVGESRSFQTAALQMNRERLARDVGAARANNFRAGGGFAPARGFAPAGGFSPGRSSAPARGGGRGR